MVKKVDFRSKAKEYLANAKEELSSGSEKRLKYAALELRMAMEAVTYSRAEAYKDDISPDEYATWQPKKLMSFLLEVDPHVDQTSTLSVGIEENIGVPATEMNTLGTEHVLSLKEIKENYDAIGNYLHMPTHKQFQGNGQNLVSLRERCVKVSEKIEKVLNSPVSNVKFQITSKVDCIRCEKPMKKNLTNLKDKKGIEVKCFECSAPYIVENTEDGKAIFIPKQSSFNCTNTACNEKNFIWDDKVKAGEVISCEK